MKATITIVAIAVTAMTVAPQRGLAQYGPSPYGMPPGPLGPGPAPYGVQPAYFAPMGPAPGYGHYPGAPAAFQGPELAPPGAVGMPPAAYGPPGGAYPPGAPVEGYAPPTDAGSPAYDDCGVGGDCGVGFGMAPVFFGMEGLLWVRHGQQLPPLVTTSQAGTPAATAGVLGLPGTSVIFGDQRVEDGFMPGLRITTGVWLDPMHEVALGGRVFFLGQDEVDFRAASPTGQPVIARPFIDFNTGNESAFLVAFNDGMLVNPRIGEINVQTTNDLWGGDAFTSIMLTQGMGYRVDLQAGYQFYRIDEAVAIRSTSVRGDLAPPFNIPADTTLTFSDIFDTQNEFHGAALGALTELQQGAFSLKLLGRLAVGNMEQTVRVMGNTVIANPPPAGGGPPLPPVVLPGGILAQPSNSGEVSRDRTVVSPEVNITLGYNVNQNITLNLGYSFIYWTNVAQAGPHINRTVDLTQVNAVPPEVTVLGTDFWVMGLNGGFEWRY